MLVCSQSGGELREYGFYQKLNQVEEELRLRKERSAEYSFVRIHQRYLVNAVRVEHMDASHVAVGGRELPVSRAMKNEAMQKIAAGNAGGVCMRTVAFLLQLAAVLISTAFNTKAIGCFLNFKKNRFSRIVAYLSCWVATGNILFIGDRFNFPVGLACFCIWDVHCL